MDLFNNNALYNVLPYDGEVYYYGSILHVEQAQHYLDRLLQHIAWDYDKAIIYGKLIITKRKVAWYGDAPFNYTYSKTTKSALPWTKELLELKEIIEHKTGDTYNACLLNLYHNGSEGMAWHSDSEKDLKKNAAIASLSLGAERNFSFKHKTTKQTVSLVLEKGSLLVMKGVTQPHWLHRLPPTKKVKSARVNLTFRTIQTEASK
ncbi:alpha-ketoglutarate-dependent dioxygenase AlkB [Mariniflexile litorale]|uniref:Alpha-ketoglutarate-dependent dioxygenase AlkB n=1 Tax=Mariniflexile litorale TaxID=3045158 RepID=A0AAU7EFD0_9FLAO|nr:alpha-ketoglutarate-dependent dioxygenase AlkB [Mariniflexile sp. KMM 9835]MDQ8212294.1 alpha-ketoglutarate-dependent dioxygenase AlkB [Mariniflexile sp. KMM 9835]